MGTFHCTQNPNIDEKCLEKSIIKIGDSIYLKMDSIEELASVIKFWDDTKRKKAMDELRKSMEEDEARKFDDAIKSIRVCAGDIHTVKRPSMQTVFNSLSPKEVEETLFDHEASLCDHEDRLSHLEEELAKLEKAVMDIPKTMGKITDKMMEANMGDKDKDLKSFSMNFYWNYDDQGEDED